MTVVLTITDWAAMACIVGVVLLLAAYLIGRWRKFDVLDSVLGPDDPENYD